MRPAEHVVIAGSQQAELANDYSLLFKDEHLNPARILPLVLCIITNKKHARLPEFTVLQKSSAIPSNFHQDLTIFHIASAYSFSALKTLARKLSNAPTISQSLDA